MKKKKWWKIFKIVWISLVLIFFIWNWTTFQSHNLPNDTFLNSNIVSVIETDDQITFKSDTSKNKFEIIFFKAA